MTTDTMGWWVISGEAIIAMLQRVAEGEDPEMVYLEEYANSKHHGPEDE